jgi:hypothetical protein
MSFWNKLWVHVRFVIKFALIQAIALSFSIYGAVFAILLMLLFGYSNFLLNWTLIATFFTPFAIIFEDTPVLKDVFWLWRDDSRYLADSKYLKARDYKDWIDENGGKETFWNLWKWHTRNRMYNFVLLFMKPGGKEYLIQLLKNTLINNGQPVELSDDYGYMPYDNFAGLKWITKNGSESWWTYTGVKISQKYSIFGEMSLYYRISGLDGVFYKYSKCVKLENKWWKLFFRVLLLFAFKNTFNKDLFFTFKYHANNEAGTIHIKIQWEK